MSNDDYCEVKLVLLFNHRPDPKLDASINNSRNSIPTSGASLKLSSRALDRGSGQTATRLEECTSQISFRDT